MASDPPFSDSGAPQKGRLPGHISAVRAVGVLVVFVVGVITLVAVGTRPIAHLASSPVTTTTVASHQSTTSTTTTTTVPHSSVSVVVANATSASGLAGHYTSILAAQGWAMKTATDATTHETTTKVYYASGQQVAAASIASTLGLQATAVLPLTTAVPVAGISGIDVVVVVGADLVSAAG